MNPNEVPVQNYGGGAPPDHGPVVPGATRPPTYGAQIATERYSMDTGPGGGGMIMPDADRLLSPISYGPGPGGFSIPEPMANQPGADARSQSISFPTTSDGPPPIRHDAYPAPGMPNYQQSSYNNSHFPAPPAHANTWSQNDAWGSVSQPPAGYAQYDQRPPPPAAWAFPASQQQQQEFPPQTWPHPSHQDPPPAPPGGGGYPYHSYGGGY